MPVSEDELESIPLFTSLLASERAELADWFEARDVPVGVQLVGEGATGNSFFVILDGAVAVTTAGNEVGRLGPGDFFGEIALINVGRRSASVRTTAPSRVLVMFAPDFQHLRQRFPDIAAKLESGMRERLARG